MEDSTIAYRTISFANSLAFSEKPLQPGEIFLVEIERTQGGWSGHMRLGLTLIDPGSMNGSLPMFALPNLVKLGNTWVFAITSTNAISGCLGIMRYSENSFTLMHYIF